MAARTLLGVHRATACRVRHERRHLRQPLAVDLRAHGYAGRKEREIVHHVAHVLAVARWGLAVHTALEAVGDAVLDDLHAAAPAPVLREARIDADEWHRVPSRAVIG